MKAWIKVSAAIAIITFAMTASANQPDSFAVTAKLTHAGQSFAEPSAIVWANSPSSIEVTGPDGYRLTLTVSDVSSDQIRVAANLDSVHGSMAPTAVVAPGVPASFLVGDLGLELTISPHNG